MIKEERKNEIIRILNQDYNSVDYLAKGKRSVVYLLDDRDVAKIERDDISAENVVRREFYFLNKLSDYDCFPKIMKYYPDLRFLTMSYIKGVGLGDVDDYEVFIKTLSICRILDKKGINQSEMNNPYKHVIVSDEKVGMIDFEKSVESNKVHNVTQFVNYIMDRHGLERKNIIHLAKNYGNNPCESSFKKLLSFLKLKMIH